MPDVTKWVQVDLGREVPLDEVRLFPARPTDFADAPGSGWWWDHAVAHPTLPVGGLWRERADDAAPPLSQLLSGPGLPNLVGALRKAMAVCGYESVKELQKAELVVTSE